MPAAEDSFHCDGQTRLDRTLCEIRTAPASAAFFHSLGVPQRAPRVCQGGYERVAKCGMPGLYRKLSCSDRSRSIAGSRPTPSSPRSSRSPSSSWLSRCRPAGPVEEQRAATRPVCNADLPPMTHAVGQGARKSSRSTRAPQAKQPVKRDRSIERERKTPNSSKRSRDARSLRRDKCLCPYNSRCARSCGD